MRLGSIRTKIWLCIMVVLCGYFIATVASFYSTMSQYRRFSTLGENLFPMASLGTNMLYLFERQQVIFEDAFLTGEQELAEKGATLSSTMEENFQQMEAIIQQTDRPPIPLSFISELRQEYQAYTRVALAIPGWVTESLELSISRQQEIRSHGQRQQYLHQQFSSLDKKFSLFFLEEIEGNKRHSLQTILVLVILFILVLLWVTLVTNKAAYRLLITPLAAIQSNVQLFAQGKEIPPPGGQNKQDEISQLALSFWQMTEDLKQTMVSKRYVDNIIHNMSGGLLVLSPTGTIQTINQQTNHLFATTDQELLGQPASKLFKSPQNTPLAALHSGESQLHHLAVKDIEVICQANDGRLFPAHFSGSTMRTDQGELEGIVCVVNDITELKDSEFKLKRLALYDNLTGLANRHLFFDHLQLAITDARRNHNKCGLLFLDLDRFKPINDQLGHDAGDQVLQEVAHRLQGLVRAGDTVARMGGDEFTMVVGELHSSEDACLIADKVVEAMNRPFELSFGSCSLGISIGIAIYPDHSQDQDELITLADQAMYQAKARGRNGFALYQPKTDLAA